jgi:hypothetical protein
MNFKEWLIAEEGGYRLCEAASYEKRLQKAIADAQAIAKFYHNNDRRYPIQESPNKEEKTLGKTLAYFRQKKKQQVRENTFIGSIYEKIEQAGKYAELPEDWMDAADYSLEGTLKRKIAYAQAIAKFYHKNKKRYPSSKSPNEEEKSLGKILADDFRQKKKQQLRANTFIGSIYEKVEKAGIDAKLPPDWMDAADHSIEGRLKQKIAYAQAIAKFYHKNKKRYPSQKSPYEEEKTLSKILNDFRQKKKQQLRANTFIGSMWEKAEKAGKDARLPEDWMDAADHSIEARLKQKIATAQAIAEFYHKNDKRYPSGNDGLNEKEKSLGRILGLLRQDKKKLVNDNKFIGSIFEKVEQAGIKARLPEDWMDIAYAPPKKFVNHQELVRILKNLKLAENFNFQPEMLCFREGKSCLRYDGAYKDSEGNPIAVFEYQGEQHYHPTNLSGLRKFLKGAENDSDKLNITRQNNIPLLSIPFWKKNQMESLVSEFMQAVLNAPNNKLSPSQWKHYAVDISIPNAQQQQIIDKKFCRFFNSATGKEDAALVALYPEIKKKWKMCQNDK